MLNTRKVVTRFAPSPTGSFHLGNARTALFNFLYARKMGGTFILRIEDTDAERSKKEYEESILEGLHWLGLTYDEFCRQSERTDIYKEFLQKLINNGRAYVSKEEAVEGKRAEVIRLKNSGTSVTFNDEIRGEINVDTTDLGDFVIAKSMDEPLYHLAVVVDDFLMGTTHVIRGEDHISNTPRQILIADAIEAPRPIYAHLPLILAPDRSKLSKRHGAVSVTEYREMGYLSEALVNFLVLLGWSPQGGSGVQEEIFFLDDLIKKFEMNKVGRSGAIFNIEKFDWINREHLKRLPKDKLEDHLLKFIPPKLRSLPSWNMEQFRKIIPILLERIVKLSDAAEMANAGDLDFFFKEPEYVKKDLIWKKDTGGKIIIAEIDGLLNTIGEISDTTFTELNIKNATISFIGNKDRGSILWPMRYALSGKNNSPNPFIIAEIVGREETLKRLQTAKRILNNN